MAEQVWGLPGQMEAEKGTKIPYTFTYRKAV